MIISNKCVSVVVRSVHASYVLSLETDKKKRKKEKEVISRKAVTVVVFEKVWTFQIEQIKIPL